MSEQTCAGCRHWREADLVWDAKTGSLKPGEWRWCDDLVVTAAFHADRRIILSLRQARDAAIDWDEHLRTREHFGCRRFEPLTTDDADDDQFWRAA